jgi:hypothetical protein
VLLSVFAALLFVVVLVVVVHHLLGPVGPSQLQRAS